MDVNCIKKCDESFDNIFNKFENELNDLKLSHKKCFIICTDKLNFPSEELLCYEKCEDAYNNLLEKYKNNLFNDFNKLKNI